MTNEELLEEYRQLSVNEAYAAWMGDGRAPNDPGRASRIAELRGVLLIKLDVNESFDKVPLPTSVEQAELMEKVGFAYLKEHAPERLVPNERRDPPLGMFAVINGEDAFWDGEDWAPARILKHRLPMKLTDAMDAEMAKYVEAHIGEPKYPGMMQEIWDRALQAWMKWPPSDGSGVSFSIDPTAGTVSEPAPTQDPGREQVLLNLAADAVDERWREKGGINCTEVCAIIRGALSLAAPIRLTPTLTIDPLAKPDYLSTAEPFGYVYEERTPVRYTFRKQDDISAADLADYEIGVHPVYLRPQDEPAFDATDGAHPAWWRGEKHGTDAAVKAVMRMLNGDLFGTFGHPGLERLRKHIAGLTSKFQEALGITD